VTPEICLYSYVTNVMEYIRSIMSKLILVYTAQRKNEKYIKVEVEILKGKWHYLNT